MFTLQNAKPKVDGQTGALVQNLKLDIPPGRNGLQPDLALQYNSQRAEDGIAGYGWTITIPYIQRLNKLGSQSLYNAPYFTSSIDGELATTSSATTTSFVAKVDDGSFNSYSFTNNVWTMYDKSGTRYTFGASDNAQQNASASSTLIYTWMLQEIRDTNGNYVRYVYSKDSGQIYPQKIYYTGNGSTDGVFTITFATSTRSDTYINYKPLFKVTTSYRISQISAAISGTTVRQYALSYTSGNNGVRSLLSSLQETGWDANGQNAVTLPAMTFSYQNDNNWFAENGHGVKDAAYVIADVNGNSKNDITLTDVSVLPSTPSGTTWPDSGSGTSLPTPPGYWGFLENTSCLSYRPAEAGLRFVDVNADGKADYVEGDFNYTTSVQNGSAAINTYTATSGYSWNGTATGTIPAFSSDGSGSIHGLTTGLFGDLNGDGLPDYEGATGVLGAGLGGFDTTYLGNGSLWESGTTSIFAPKQELPVGTPTVTNSQLIDINGDGLADWVYSDSSNTYVLLNTGTGWESTPSSQWTIATSTLYLVPGSNPAQYYDRGMRFVDVNGDGLVDFVRAFKNSTSTGNSNDEAGDFKVVMLNTGNGWATTAWSGTSITYITQGAAVSSMGQCYDEPAIWTGNGQNDQDVLSTITYPQGGSASVTYVKSAAGNNPQLPISLLVVSKIITNDGFGNTAEKDYTYSGGQIYTALGVRNNKFAGFATTTETDANTITTTSYDQGDWINRSYGEQNDGYGQLGHPYRIDTTNASNGQLLKTVFNRWDTATLVNKTFVFLARQVEQDYGPSGSHRDTATDYSYSTITGNVTQVTRYGEVTGNSDGTFGDTGTDKSTETLLYVGDATGTAATTTQTFTSSTAWIAPTGVTSVTVDMWGGGGGGAGGTDADVGGGAGAYVHATSVLITPGSAYTVTIGTGGGGGISSAAGTGGTGYASGGNGSVVSCCGGGGGGGGGSSAFTNDGTILIASGGGGGGATGSNTAATGSGGGAGDPGNGPFGPGGGGGGSATAGGTGSASGASGGTGGTTQTGTNGAGGTAGGSSAGSSGNGSNGGGSCSGDSGANGSGGAAGGTIGNPGTNGTSTNSGGGGGSGPCAGGNGGNGGAPGAGGGGGGGAGHQSGSGGNGEVILTYTGSATTTSTSTILNAVWDDTVVDQSSSTVRETRHYYDGLALNSVNLGNETKTETWISGTTTPTYASTTKVYDGTYGLVTQSRDANGNLSTSTLDANHLYVATTTNALFQTTGNQYDYSTGKVKATFDVNRRLFTTLYDALGRPLSVNEPDPSSGTTVTKTAYVYTDSSTPGATSIQETDYLSSATSTNTYTYFDGLNRKLQVRKQAEGNNTYSVKDWTYNNIGLLKSGSLPYFASSTARSNATTTAKLFTTYSYDGLQRITATANSVGTTTNTYSKWTVTTTDPNGNLKDYTKDAYGNLATVAEYFATSSATTTYAWDLNKSLTKLTDALGNVRNFTYDGLGRRLTAQDLHAVSDGTFGTWTYTYDAAGNLASSTDAKSQTVTNTYDVLNRKVTEDYGGQAGTEVTNTYDSCTNGVGRLCTASSTNAKITNAYDPDGDVSNATTTVGGVNYGMSYTYERQANLTYAVYPNNARVNYNFNSAGLTDSISYSASGTSTQGVVDNLDYGPDGQTTVQADHNQITTTRTYDANAQYRLTRILTCGTQCLTSGSASSSVYTSSGTWTAPSGVTSVTVDMWGAGGGGAGGTDADIGGGAGAYVHATATTTPGNNYTVTIGVGGGGGKSSAAGTGGTGYASGGNGSLVSCCGGGGGGGGGSSAFTNNGATLIASGGGGGGASEALTNNASGSSGGAGDPGNGTFGPGGGGGGSATTGGTGSAGGASGGTGGTTQTGTNGAGKVSGGTSAGSAGNGNTGLDSGASGSAGVTGSGGASRGGISGNGTSGSGTDSGGSGGGAPYASGTGGNGGAPGAGGGGAGGAGNQAGNGANGEVILGYGSTSSSTGSTFQDLNYTYDADGNITQIKSIASSTASTTVHYTYDTLNRLTNAYTNTGPGITARPHNYWGMNGTSSDSVGGLIGTDGAMSYASSSGVIPKGAFFNGTSSKINIGIVASGTVNLSAGAWVKTSAATEQWIIGQDDVGTVNGQWRLALVNGKVSVYTQATGGAGTIDYISGNISVNDGKWHYVGFSQAGPTYSIYVDGVLDVQKTIGTPVSYDPTVGSGIGYDRRDAANYFSWSLDELGVWYTTLSNMDFLTLYNAGIGYAYPYGSSTLATTTYNPQYYTYDALGNFTAKGTNRYTYAQTNYANPDAVTQIANGTATTSLSYDNDGNLTSAGTSTFSWDYNNRMTQAVTGSTSTYAYDYNGNRVSQTVGSTTTIYPNKYYSITSTTNGATTYATTTVYVWNGNTLIATIDQALINGSATGTAAMRYIHPDHLGSTNIVTDESGNVVTSEEYYPYGEMRYNEVNYPTNEQRQYIGQFKDGNSLSYLNARYYNSAQGQFLSEDPVFLGDPSQQNLQDPQSLNAYSYAEDNPVNRKDPSGQAATLAGLLQGLSVVLKSLSAYLASTGSGASSKSGSLPTPTMTTGLTVPMRSTTWDPVSDKRIKQLDPRLQKPATNFINDTQDWTGIKLRVNEGYRSVADQNADYAKGRDAQGNVVDPNKIVTYAKGGQSYHNYGLALDVVIMNNGQPDWTQPITPDIASYGQQQGFEWGGTWPAPKTDDPHFQMTFGQSWQSLLSNSSQ